MQCPKCGVPDPTLRAEQSAYETAPDGQRSKHPCSVETLYECLRCGIHFRIVETHPAQDAVSHLH